MMRKAILLGTLLAVAAGTWALATHGRSLWVPMVQQLTGKRTVDEVLDRYGEAARARLQPRFDHAGVRYPPAGITLLALKDRAELELWAETDNGPRHVHSYPIAALSGGPGPKLREGDRQVPEGLYRIEGLNPNSAYHLSMKLNYPNAFDLKHSAAEGRDQPGTNIFIHGKAVSIGCLAMGDPAIEELFVLAADAGRDNIRVAIAPSDPRSTALSESVEPAWVGDLYRELNTHFARYHLPPAATKPK